MITTPKWKAPTYSEIDKFQKELAPLHKELDTLQNKVAQLCSKRNRVRDRIDKEALKGIPQEPEQLTPAQWRWVLKTSNEESMSHHQFKEGLIFKLGFYTCGYFPETEQPALAIPLSLHTFDKLKTGLKILLKYLKPVKVGYIHRHSKGEVGVRITVGGIPDHGDDMAVMYIHEDNTITLYTSRFSDPKKFRNLKRFFIWCEATLRSALT